MAACSTFTMRVVRPEANHRSFTSFRMTSCLFRAFLGELQIEKLTA